MKKEFLSDFFTLLNEKYQYAVLRNFADLPNDVNSHDIDLLIKEKELKSLKKDVFLLIQEYEYKVLFVNKTEKMATIVICRIVDNELEYLFLDFFLKLSLFGVYLQDADDVLVKRKFNGKVYHVHIVDEFIEKYLYNTLLNHPYPEKYKIIREKVLAENYEKLLSTMQNIFGNDKIDIESFNTILGKKYLLYAFLSNLKKMPIKQIVLPFKFMFFYFKAFFFPKGFSMGLTGPDGSGKTTILNQIQKELHSVYGRTKLHHFRPTVIPRIAELFKKSGLKKEVDENYDKPHRGGKTSKASSWFRLLYYITDYIIGYYKVVKPVLFRRGIIIFDRYYTDIISDSKRSRIYLNYKMIFMLRKLVPNMDYNFIIFVDPELILQRKQELTREQIDEIYEKLNHICEQDKNYTPINNDAQPQIAVNAILDNILEQQDKKYRKFFK
ncbi:MAG: hypothetical protein GQ570_13720 [Helicobacteraceae bacterium]|nr:hypothetical protein [Helicobacteraceae bacterium]